MAQISTAPHHSNSSGSVNSEKNLKSQKEMVPGTFLGIDFGKSKIGLAIADEETKMAFSFDILKNDADFWNNLRKICDSENVKKIIIGTPSYKINQDGAEGIVKFAEKVKTETGIEVELEDEMFTTKMAQDGLKERGSKNVATKDDSAAAQIILQSWLDKK